MPWAFKLSTKALILPWYLSPFWSSKETAGMSRSFSRSANNPAIVAAAATSPVEGSSVRKSFSKLLAAATVRLVGLWTTIDLTYCWRSAASMHRVSSTWSFSSLLSPSPFFFLVFAVVVVFFLYDVAVVIVFFCIFFFLFLKVLPQTLKMVCFCFLFSPSKSCLKP